MKMKMNMKSGKVWKGEDDRRVGVIEDQLTSMQNEVDHHRLLPLNGGR